MRYVEFNVCEGTFGLAASPYRNRYNLVPDGRQDRIVAIESVPSACAIVNKRQHQAVWSSEAIPLPTGPTLG
jgi:hypothetical protein